MEEYRRLTPGEIVRRISGKRVMIVCHRNPDGDAVGSAYGLLRLVELSGGLGKVVTPTPIPERLRFIADGDDTSYIPGMEDSFDLKVTVDTASPSQLGELSHLADVTDISIDHHASTTLYADNLTDPKAAATGVLVYELALESVMRGYVRDNLSPVMKRAFAAIASDTGSFAFANTNARAFSSCSGICGYLEENNCEGDHPIDGMTTHEISAALFGSVTKKDVLIRRLANNNLTYICGGSAAVSVITADEIRENSLDFTDLGSVVDQVRGIEGTLCGISVRQSPDSPDEYRCSARSNVEFDVARLAAVFGGGGHVRAAGFSVIASSKDEALAKIESALSGEIAEYGKSAAVHERTGEIFGV